MSQDGDGHFRFVMGVPQSSSISRSDFPLYTIQLLGYHHSWKNSRCQEIVFIDVQVVLHPEKALSGHRSYRMVPRQLQVGYNCYNPI